MKKIYLIGTILMLLLLTGCTTTETVSNGAGEGSRDGEGVGKQLMEQDHSDYNLDDYPIEELSAEEIDALNLTLNDEYKAKMIYQKVLEKFGDVKPFSNIINAEMKHSDELIALYEKYDLVVPENNWYDKVPEFDSVTEACAAGVDAEIENVALYDELFAQIDNQDITAVFTSLRDASLEKHLPAFERCADK